MAPIRNDSPIGDEEDLEPTYNGKQLSEAGSRVAMLGLEALTAELKKPAAEQNSARLDGLANAVLAGIGCTDDDL